jgi:hypothetical protein
VRTLCHSWRTWCGDVIQASRHHPAERCDDVGRSCRGGQEAKTIPGFHIPRRRLLVSIAGMVVVRIHIIVAVIVHVEAHVTR